MPVRSQPTPILPAIVLLGVGAVTWLANTTESLAQSRDHREPPVAKHSPDDWIHQLGHPSFQHRELAARRLQELGGNAFLPLLEHENASDREIRQRVRYLLDRLRPKMIQENVPDVDRYYVADYLGLMKDDRKERILVLGDKLAPEFCVEALVRLAQIERDTQLSKLAALGVMGNGAGASMDLKRLRAQLDLTVADASGKTAIQWLGMYRRLLDEPRSVLDELKEMLASEEQLLREMPQQTDEARIVVPLKWLYAETLWRAGEEENALDSFGAMLNGLRDRELRLKMLEWLRKQGRCDVVARLATAHAAWFEANPRAHYLVAACLIDDGQPEAGDALAQAISATVDDPQLCYGHALWLREQALSDWSIREYLKTIENTENDSFEHIAAHNDLSLIYHYQDRNLQAAEQLRELLKILESSPAALGQAETITRTDLVESNMHYYLAKHFGEIGDTEKQVDHYRQALDEWELHSDAIINAYQIADAPADWAEEIRGRVDESVDSLQLNYARTKAKADQVTDYSRLRVLHVDMAQTLNELAWILAHTESDPSTALKVAHLSIQIDPTRGYALDTLATCYYFAQDYEKAVAFEKQSLLLLPNREDVQRTLATFQTALDQQH